MFCLFKLFELFYSPNNGPIGYIDQHWPTYQTQYFRHIFHLQSINHSTLLNLRLPTYLVNVNILVHFGRVNLLIVDGSPSKKDIKRHKGYKQRYNSHNL